MSSFSERNARKTGKNQSSRTPNKERPDKARSVPANAQYGANFAPRAPRDKVNADNFIWGRHPVLAALANPARSGMGRLMVSEDRALEIEQQNLAHGHRIEVVDSQQLTKMLPTGAVHQGMVFKVQPLEGITLEEMAEDAQGVIVMLDQLTDTQNIGAIFRSALAFGAKGIVLHDRSTPALAGALAKAAVGATERLPCARVTNLSRALEKLDDLGWRAVGMDGEAELTLEQALDNRPTVIVMGSEGDGVRRLVAEHCEVMAKIPMPGGFESLNVSNAAAIALYEASRAQLRD